ncbi:hypothetical protein METBIDRAFT_18204, partial [Metschnikowia bicuspidata var. bicuspidata NRRL YB-4993]
ESEDGRSDIDLDPFVIKATEAEARRRKLLEIFFALTGNSSSEIKDTTLIQLFFTHEIEFLDLDFMAILRLNASDVHHRQLYYSFLYLVQHTAMILKTRIFVKLLAEMPLTDIRRICYRIADKYDSLFYVPVKAEGEDEDANLALCFEWNDRFNCMWPILSLISREYK